MREAKLRDIMRKYIFVSYENEPNKNKIGITKIKVDISKNNVRNYMDYLLMREMRLPFIESHLLYKRLPLRQVCFIINISFLIQTRYILHISEQYIFNDMRKILINIIKVYMNVHVCGNDE